MDLTVSISLGFSNRWIGERMWSTFAVQMRLTFAKVNAFRAKIKWAHFHSVGNHWNFAHFYSDLIANARIVNSFQELLEVIQEMIIFNYLISRRTPWRQTCTSCQPGRKWEWKGVRCDGGEEAAWASSWWGSFAKFGDIPLIMAGCWNFWWDVASVESLSPFETFVVRVLSYFRQCLTRNRWVWKCSQQ